MWVQVVVYNRTPSKAEVVASRFNGKAVGDLTDTKVGPTSLRTLLRPVICTTGTLNHPPSSPAASLFCLARQALMEATGGRPITVIVSTIPAAAGFTVRRTDWCQLLGVL